MKIKLPKIIQGNKLKWGVAGLGKFSENSFIPSLLHLRKSKLVSLFSNDLKRAKVLSENFSAENYFDDYDKFLASDIEAVYIGSSNKDHYQQVIKAAKAGKHILCDKPMSLTSKEAEEMVRICKENKVQFAVNYVYRFHPLIVKAKEIIENELIGKIISINVNFHIDLPPNNNFRFSKEQSGGGAMRDLGTHMIDLLRFLGGEITKMTGVVDNVLYNCEVDDFAAGLGKYESGGYATFTVSFNTKKAFNKIDITGSKGSIGIESLIGSRAPSSKMIILHEGETTKAFRKRGNKLLVLLKNVEEAFLNNVPPKVTGEDGLINMKLMEEIENSWIPKKK